MRAGAAQGARRVVEWGVDADHRKWTDLVDADDRLLADVAVEDVVEHVLQVEVAGEGAVEAAHREPGETGVADGSLDRPEGGADATGHRIDLDVDAAHPIERDHHLRHRAGDRPQCAGQTLVFLRVDQAFLTGLAEHLREFDGRDRRIELVLRLDAQCAKRDVRQPVVERDERADDLDEAEVNGDEQHGCAFRTGERDVLGHHLAEQDVQHRNESERHGERDGVQQRLGDMCDLEW